MIAEDSCDDDDSNVKLLRVIDVLETSDVFSDRLPDLCLYCNVERPDGTTYCSTFSIGYMLRTNAEEFMNQWLCFLVDGKVSVDMYFTGLSEDEKTIHEDYINEFIDSII